MRSSWRPQWLLVLIAGTLFFFNLGATHLWDVDEAIFSQAAREMYERGDAVTPYFNGAVFPDKPAMMYWLMMSAYELFGPTEFAARFWSAVFGIASVLITYRLGRLMFSPAVAFWAGLILATSLNFNVIARAATPDSFLTFFSALAMLAFVAATATARPRSGAANERNVPWAGQTRFEPSWLGWCLVYAAMGLAVLTKGPIGVLLPTATLGLFLLVVRAPAAPEPVGCERGWRAFSMRLVGFARRTFAPLFVLRTIWSMRPLTAVAMVLLVAGPWYVLVGLATEGEWLVGFFGVHNFGRFTGAMDNHSGPIFYYLVAIAIGFFPWSVLATPTLLHMRRLLGEGHAWRPGYVFVCAWIVVWVGFFSLAGTKLPSYIIPAYPALALLTACFVAGWVNQAVEVPRLYTRLAWGCIGLTGVGLLVGLPIAAHLLLDGQWYLGTVGLIPLAAALIGWLATERGRTQQAAWTMAVAGSLMWLTIFGIFATQVDRYQESPVFAARIAAEADTATPELRTFHHFRPSYVFYTSRVVTKLESAEAVGEFFQATPQAAFVITNDRQFEKLNGKLPADVEVLEQRQVPGQDEQVMLLGRKNLAATATKSGGSAAR